MLTVIKNKKPNGVQYSTYEKKFFEHHEQYGEILIEYDLPIVFNDGELITPFKLTDKQIQAQHLRAKRQVYCFDVVNRGQVWYETLSQVHRDELQAWYQAWLDAPQTLKEPSPLTWL